MMYDDDIYTFKPAAFIDDSDEENVKDKESNKADLFSNFRKNKQKKQKCRKNDSATTIKVDSDSDNDFSLKHKSFITENIIEIDSGISVKDIAVSKVNEMMKKNEQEAKSQTPNIDLTDDTLSNAINSASSAWLACLNNVKRAAREINLVDEKYSRVTQNNDNQDRSILDGLTTVKTSAQRLLDSSNFETDYLSRNTTASSSSVVEVVDAIKLKTRLNGKHEWKWKIPKDDSFKKLREKFSEVYGLLDSKVVTFLWDGEAIADSETLVGLGVEDDDLIDVKISPKLYNHAVNGANSYKSQPSAVSGVEHAVGKRVMPNESVVATSISTSKTSGSNVTSERTIRVTTRLNGKHEWKWLIGVKANMKLLKNKFCVVYGVSNINDLKFSFDGEVLADAATVTSSNLEDEDLIDVKIKVALLEACVKSASAFQAEGVVGPTRVGGGDLVQVVQGPPAATVVQSITSKSQSSNCSISPTTGKRTIASVELVVSAVLTKESVVENLHLTVYDDITLKALQEAPAVKSLLIPSYKQKAFYTIGESAVPISVNCSVQDLYVMQSGEGSASQSTLRIYMHPWSESNQVFAMIRVSYENSTAKSSAGKKGAGHTAQPEELCCVKVKLSQTCQKLMSAVQSIKNITDTQCKFRIEESFPVVRNGVEHLLRADETFYQLGMTKDSHVVMCNVNK